MQTSKLAQLFPEQTEYIQAVNQLIDNLNIDKAWYSRIESDNMLERLFLPDRIINFNVQWRDDNGKVNINQGWKWGRTQYFSQSLLKAYQKSYAL